MERNIQDNLKMMIKSSLEESRKMGMRKGRKKFDSGQNCAQGKKRRKWESDGKMKDFEEFELKIVDGKMSRCFEN